MGYWIYLIIFFAAIVQVSTATIRIILMTKGRKFISSLIAIAESSIWVILLSSVIANVQSDSMRMVSYVLGFATGIYIGSVIENFLALGHCTFQIITDNEEGELLIEILRDKGFGVTKLTAHGKDTLKLIIIMHVKRKSVNDAFNIVSATCPNAIITLNESKTILNGYGIRSRRIG